MKLGPYSHPNSLTGPFSWKKPSSEEHPGPPSIKASDTRWIKNLVALTIGPEKEFIPMSWIVCWPEPAPIIPWMFNVAKAGLTHQKNSFRVSFALDEMGINPDHEGPTLKGTEKRIKHRNMTMYYALTVGQFRTVNKELVCFRVVKCDGWSCFVPLHRLIGSQEIALQTSKSLPLYIRSPLHSLLYPAWLCEDSRQPEARDQRYWPQDRHRKRLLRIWNRGRIYSARRCTAPLRTQEFKHKISAARRRVCNADEPGWVIHTCQIFSPLGCRILNIAEKRAAQQPFISARGPMIPSVILTWVLAFKIRQECRSRISWKRGRMILNTATFATTLNTKARGILCTFGEYPFPRLFLSTDDVLIRDKKTTRRVEHVVWSCHQ